MTADEPLEHWVDVACIGFEDDLVRLMERAGMNQSDLARAAGTSPAYISKILNEGSNYTLRTMAKLARAVKAVVQVRLIDEESEVTRVLTLEEARQLDSNRSASEAVAIPQLDRAEGARNVVHVDFLTEGRNRSRSIHPDPDCARDVRAV